MCRSIRTLRPPYAANVTDADIRAAALQYVQVVGGLRLPSPANEAAFNQAVAAITATTRQLLASLETGASRGAG